MDPKTKKFIDKATAVHGDRYNYDLVEYANTHTKVQIVCSDHGSFYQTPITHLKSKTGCKKCSSNSPSTANFISRASIVHDNRYDYSLTKFVNMQTKVTIVCPEHGPFEQRPQSHVYAKRNCPSCAPRLAHSSNTETFLATATSIHGDAYDYSQVQYTNNHTKVTIVCPEHGPFEQLPKNHTSCKQGCPKCGANARSEYTQANISVGEQQLGDFIKSLDVDIQTNDRTLIHPYELDILITSHNIAVEYCGLYWHSEQKGKDRHYHKRKHDLCKTQGIQLITIFEDEWISRRSQVERKLRSLIGKINTPTVYARKCEIVRVSGTQKKAFFNENHIQGNGPGSINIGLIYNSELVACMSFIKQKDLHYLNRYATNAHVPGGFTKLLKNFMQTTEWSSLVSFADLRWSTGNLYASTGWHLDGVLNPDYSYVNQQQRFHKFNYRRKNLPKLLDVFDPALSEKKNCDNNGVLRIWDCGKLRYTLQNEI